MKRVATAVAVCVLLVSMALAGPDMITYQGYPTVAGGAPFADNTYGMRFVLYDASSGGTALWSETDNSVSVQGGLFSTTLGDGVALATVLSTYSNLVHPVATFQRLSTTVSTVSPPSASGGFETVKTVPASWGRACTPL